MGIITVEKANQLFWLGRYVERVYTTIREFFIGYDRMLDEKEDSYKDFCARINIPDCYENKEHFLKEYPFHAQNPDSIISNLSRAYDNAIVNREEIGTETLSYIQLAIYDLKKAEVSTSPLIEMQNVIDNLLAFWGSVDDCMDDEQIRSIVKAGRRVERLDLYLRFEMDREVLQRELKKLLRRMPRTELRYNPEVLDDLSMMLGQRTIDYTGAVYKLESMIDI